MPSVLSVTAATGALFADNNLLNDGWAIYITRSFAHFCVHRVSSLIKISLIDSYIVGLFASGTSLWTRPFLKAALYFVHSLPSRGGEGSCESMNQSILTKINASFSLPV